MYIIIGATSFIGIYVAEEFLKHGIKIAVTDRKNKLKDYYDKLGVEYYNLDITKKEDFDKLPKKDVQGVILLAALLPANVEGNNEIADEYFLVNTIGTFNVLEYCRKNNINRVIATTSYADVINSWSKDKAITEEEPRNYAYSGDHAVYVFSKNAANDLLEYYNQEYNMKNAVFRFPMVLGIGPHGYYSINGTKKKSGFQIFLDNAINGENINIFGDSSVTRDMVYVKDVSQAFYKAMLSEKTYGLYNITSGEKISLLEQAEIMIEVFGDKNKSKINLKPEIKNRSKSFWFSIEKAKKDFEYLPKFSDFKYMMLDYKKDLENKKYKDLFEY